MSDEFRWPAAAAILLDGLTPIEVIDALYAPPGQRMDNRTPPEAPTFLAICAQTNDHVLIVVVCTRNEVDEPWTIVAARKANQNEQQMWEKHTS